jgi:hypothetical protein
MRTIQWPEEAEPGSSRERPRVAWLGTMVGTVMPVRYVDHPSRSRARDVLVTLTFVAILVLIGVLLLFYEPLPRIFPATPGGLYVPR